MKTPSICFRLDLDIFLPHVSSKTKKTLCFSLFFCPVSICCCASMSFLTFPLTNTHVQSWGQWFNSNDHTDFDSWSETEEFEEDAGRYTFFFWSSAFCFRYRVTLWPSFTSPSMSFNLICGCDSLRRISVFQFRDFLLAVLLTNTYFNQKGTTLNFIFTGYLSFCYN